MRHSVLVILKQHKVDGLQSSRISGIIFFLVKRLRHAITELYSMTDYEITCSEIGCS